LVPLDPLVAPDFSHAPIILNAVQAQEASSSMQSSQLPADDATSVTSSEDAERVIEHGIQAGFVGES
jgi:hypothetical protein